MTEKKRTLFVEPSLTAVLALLVLPLLHAGQAGALYFIDGAKGTGPVYNNPNHGMCVIGIKANDNVLVDANNTNSKAVHPRCDRRKGGPR